MQWNNAVFTGVSAYCSDIMGARECGWHPSFPRGLTRLFEIENLIACTGYTVPTAKTIFVNVVEVIFGSRGEEIAELKVMETTSMFEICVAKFIEIMDSGRIMGLGLVILGMEVTGFIETGGGGGFTIKEP